MKSKIILFLVVFLLGLGMINILSSVCRAGENVTVKNVSAQLLNTRPPVGGRIIREYQIGVVLCNTGDTNSTTITVKFLDPETGISGNLTMQPVSYSLQPNEEKLFVFDKWPTTLSGNVILNISYGPSSVSTIKTSHNSGFFVYTLSIGNGNTTSTPGFEILFVLIAFLPFFLKIKMKKM